MESLKSCYSFAMADINRLLELALKGLEVDLAQINQQSRDLQSQLGLSNGTKQIQNSVTPQRSKATGKKGQMTEAGRRALSEAAKRRWKASKKAGKTTL
jgi:hypothetical protein